MPTLSENVYKQVASDLATIAALIETAINDGDSVTAIATRLGIDRAVISRLRNGTYRSDPSYGMVKAICQDLGGRLMIHPGKKLPVTAE